MGLKTWGSSHVLAKSLPRFSSEFLSHLFPSSDRTTRPIHILELGSGTGLLGLAAACTWGTHVVLSDLPEIVSNLAYNAELNELTVKERGGSVHVGVLSWGGTDEVNDPSFHKANGFEASISATLTQRS